MVLFIISGLLLGLNMVETDDQIPTYVPKAVAITPLLKDKDNALPHISVIIEEAKPAEMLQISSHAVLPDWLQ